ncbi:MAG: Hsp20/alpha crystallin family protein [Acidobacteriia bacterium]|jgi:HSP20 family molecular chaperone IbpA|nr:Hsp20/alpha crystallin family protein [Terriglobia bacterium]
METVRITCFERDADAIPAIEEFERLMDHVSRRAYQLFEERGRYDGMDLDDWLQAENQMLGTPAAETEELEGEFRTVVTLPWFQAEDIEISVGPGEMVVRAELLTEAGVPTMKVMRRFQYPKAVEVSLVRAEFADGLLVVVAPKQSTR